MFDHAYITGRYRLSNANWSRPHNIFNTFYQLKTDALYEGHNLAQFESVVQRS